MDGEMCEGMDGEMCVCSMSLMCVGWMERFVREMREGMDGRV